MNYEDRVTKEYVEGLLSGGLKIATGTYVGDGRYGSGSLGVTFPFVPKLVIVSDGKTTDGHWFVWYTGVQYMRACNNDSYRIGCYLVGNTLNWYSSTAEAQFNTNGATYCWVAIG